MVVIVLWVVFVVMMIMVFYYSFEFYFGIFNKFFYDIGLLDDVVGYGWIKNFIMVFIWLIVIVIFVLFLFMMYMIFVGF